MAKINKRFCKLTNEQFIAQRNGEGFEKYTIVFISDKKKIWHDGIEYGANDAEIGEVIQTLIVNDLTTGGTDKALSAEQGKQLKTLVDQINAEIEAGKEYTVNGHKISENPVLDKTDVGLGNVTNDAQVKRSEMGVANGVATLGGDGKVPSAQLPSYVDDVIEIQKVVDAKASIPTSGLTVGQIFYATAEKKMFTATSETEVDEGVTPEAGKIYIAVADGNKQYRWGGDAAGLVQITSGNIVIGETAGTAYEGSKGKANADLLASLGSKLITSVDAPTADAEKVTFNYKAITKSTNFDAEAPSTIDIPAATSSSAGVMTAAQATELEQLRTDMTAVGNNTVNGHKISENPTLNGADIALTGFAELPEETVNEALKPEATDTVNQATAKLYKAIIDNEEVVASAFAELIKSVGLDEHLKYVNKPGDLTASDIAGVIAEINTKVNNIKTQYEATKSDYEAFKAQFDWYEGE